MVCVLGMVLMGRAPLLSAQTGITTVAQATTPGWTPYRGFLPVNCWHGQEWSLIQNAWQAARDSVAVRREGLPILDGFSQFTPQRWRTRGTVTDSLRLCDAALTASPEAVRGLQLLDAARIKLAVGQDVAAWAFIERYLAEVGTAPPKSPYQPDRAWALQLAIQAYTDVLPIRWAIAERLVTELDQLPKASLHTRWLAHRTMMLTARFAESNDAKVLQSADALYRLWAQNKMEVEETYADDLGTAIIFRTEVIMRQQGLVAAKAVIDSGYQVLADNGHVSRGLNFFHDVYTRNMGKPAAPLQATVWFHAPDSGRGARPAVGKVTLLYRIRGNRGMANTEIFNHFRFLHAMHAKYGTQGLELVALDQTERWFRDSIYEDGAQEIEARRRYWMDSVGFPGILGIFQITDWRQLQDGGWQHKPTSRDMNYPLRITVVDKQGRIVYTCDGGYDSFPQEYMDALLQRLVTQ